MRDCRIPFGSELFCCLHGYTVHQTMLKLFYYQLMHIMLKNTELLKHSKITLQHVSLKMVST